MSHRLASASLAIKITLLSFLIFYIALIAIAIFYTVEYYQLRHIMAIKKRRPKLMLFLNCSTILYMIHSAFIYQIGFIFLPHNEWYHFTMVDGCQTLIAHIFVWGNALRFWLVFYDIRWSKACEMNEWKV